jgi:hypothetical protein
MSSTINTFRTTLKDFIEIIVAYSDTAKEWYIDGDIHKTNYHSNNIGNVIYLREEKIYENNKVVKYREYNDNIGYSLDIWYNIMHLENNDIMHCENNNIMHRGNNNIMHCENGNIMHRENAPAYICKEDNITTEERWIVNGFFHRLTGPAYIEYQNISNDIEPIYKEYWINGREYFKELYYKYIMLCHRFIDNIRRRIRKNKEKDLYRLGFNKDISKMISEFV